MLFFIAILVGLLMAILGAKKGFYAFWALLFNILISIYLGVMLTPVVIGLITKEEVSSYYCAGCIAGLAVLIFSVLQSITFFVLIKKFKILFPKVMDSIGGGILGWRLSGNTDYLVAGLAFGGLIGGSTLVGVILGKRLVKQRQLRQQRQ